MMIFFKRNKKNQDFNPLQKQGHVEFNGRSIPCRSRDRWEVNPFQNQGKVISIAQNVETQNFAS